MRRAVFLDRDGVLTVPDFRDGRSFAPRELRDFKLYPDAADATEELAGAGFALVVVTNQPDVGNGVLARETLDRMHSILKDELPLDAIEVCPHRREDRCDCRKPASGMLLRAADRLGIDTTRSFIVGDRASDIAAGRAVGCATVFVDHGYDAEAAPDDPDFVCTTLRQASDWILSQTVEGNPSDFQTPAHG